MYYPTGFSGSTLPPKTLCLTYDDGPGVTPGSGPGPHTLEIAKYLQQHRIQATFFTVGKYAAQHPDILSQVQRCGHLVANHTFDHLRLVDSFSAGVDLVDQVTRTDSHIRKWVDGSTVFFRPPYGSWSPKVAKTLNDDFAASINHVGPILWDIDGSDWACWQYGTPPQDCLQAYLKIITEKGHGIVLLHDSSADRDAVRKANMTYTLTQLLIPILLQQRYRFVRLDSIAELRAASQVPLKFALRASDGRYVSLQGGGEILVNGTAIGPSETLEAEDLGYGRVAVRAANGLYFSPQDGGGSGKEVLANGPSVGEWEPLELIRGGCGQVAFRTVRGFFLTLENLHRDRLMATAPRMREREIFTFTNLFTEENS
jgi:peptidoglycan/xylan/chitin deacetylase (PgdA/CDA1 family)